jgi:hypothetical protein
MLWLRYVSPCQRRRVQDQGLQIYIANERFRMCFTLCQCKFGLTVCFLGGQIRCCLHQWRRYSCARKPRQRLRAWGTVSFHLLVQNSFKIRFLLCLGVSLPIPVLVLSCTITMWTQLSVTPITRSCSVGTRSTFPVDGQWFESGDYTLTQ